MNVNDFITAVSEVPGVHWEVKLDGRVRNSHDCCPVEALADIRFPRFDHYRGEVFIAARKLRLSRRTLAAIVGAADARNRGRTRRLLLKRLNLKEIR